MSSSLGQVPHSTRDDDSQQTFLELRHVEIGAPAALPEQIDRYRVKELLGAGAFGKVYLAWDETLHRDVAVKVAKVVGDARLPKDMFLEEAQALAKLKHPGIVHVNDIGQDASGQLYIVSEFIPGQSLAKLLSTRKLSVNEAVALTATVAEALQHAHGHGIVHRDVKPANILISPDGQPVLVDFGLALTTKAIGTGPELVGTAAYMSPEQARGEGHLVDGRSDVFSLGIVLFELLCGRRPFESVTVAGLRQQITAVDARPVRQYAPDVPVELGRIVQKALSRSMTERYSTAHELAVDLRQFLAPAPVSPPPLPPPAPVAKPISQSNRRIYIGWGAGVCLVILAGVVLWPWLKNTLSGEQDQQLLDFLKQQEIRQQERDKKFFDLVEEIAKPQIAKALEAKSNDTVEAVKVPIEFHNTPAEPVLRVIFEETPPIPKQIPTLDFWAEILVKRVGEKAFQPLPPKGQIASGDDNYIVRFDSKTSAYLYVFQVDSTGNVDWLYPKHAGSPFSSGKNPTSGSATKIPSEEQGALFLDNIEGFDSLCVVFSASRWERLESVLAESSQRKSAVRGSPVTREPPTLTLRGVGGISSVKKSESSLTYKGDVLNLSGTRWSSSGSFAVWSQSFKHVAARPPGASQGGG